MPDSDAYFDQLVPTAEVDDELHRGIDAIRSWRGKGPTRRLPPRRRHPARR